MRVLTDLCNMISYFLSIFTARFQKEREGNVFTGVCPFTPMGGGYPHLANRGGDTPSQVRSGGYPLPRSGQEDYPIPGQNRGYPFPRSGWGYPGYPSLVSRMGYPHQQDGVPPPFQVPGEDRGYPQL